MTYAAGYWKTNVRFYSCRVAQQRQRISVAGRLKLEITVKIEWNVEQREWKYVKGKWKGERNEDYKMWSKKRQKKRKYFVPTKNENTHTQHTNTHTQQTHTPHSPHTHKEHKHTLNKHTPPYTHTHRHPRTTHTTKTLTPTHTHTHHKPTHTHTHTPNNTPHPHTPHTTHSHITLHCDQPMHNYFTNYHTATCFDTIVSSSDSL